MMVKHETVTVDVGDIIIIISIVVNIIVTIFGSGDGVIRQQIGVQCSLQLHDGEPHEFPIYKSRYMFVAGSRLCRRRRMRKLLSSVFLILALQIYRHPAYFQMSVEFRLTTETRAATQTTQTMFEVLFESHFPVKRVAAFVAFEFRQMGTTT